MTIKYLTSIITNPIIRSLLCLNTNNIAVIQSYNLAKKGSVN